MNRCDPSFRRARPALGTIIEISVSKDGAFALMDEAFREVSRLEKIFSRFDSESELSQLNQGEPGEWFSVSPELNQVLTFGIKVERGFESSFRLMPECTHEPNFCYELNDGKVKRWSSFFTFDLGGIAKGYIVDYVFEFLQASAPGARILVNAGGDLRCSHEEQIELRVPGENEDARYSLMIDNAAVATSSLQGGLCSVGIASGKYSESVKRKNSDVMSASVVAKSCVAADALAKVALLGGAAKVSCSDFEIQNIYLFDRQGRALA